MQEQGETQTLSATRSAKSRDNWIIVCLIVSVQDDLELDKNNSVQLGLY